MNEGTNMSKNIFEGRGVSFQEIIIGKKLGGHEAVIRYLNLRCSHFQRLISQNNLEAEEQHKARLALGALSEAMLILKTAVGTMAATGKKNSTPATSRMPGR